jgi:hypothetical protein
MRYAELIKEVFDNKRGILSYQVKFFPDNPERSFTVDFAFVKRKKTAKRREFKSLPDLKPIAVFEKVVLDKRGTFEVFVVDVVEYYKIRDVYIVVFYPAQKDKDYLLLINGQKTSIPNPKTVMMSYEYDNEMLKWRLQLNEKLNKILNGEIELEYWKAVYPKLIYIDPTLEIN